MASTAPAKDVEDLRNALGDAKAFKAFDLGPSSLREKVLVTASEAEHVYEPDYFGPGHDKAVSQYTAALGKSCRDDPVLSIMFCGIGDARHLFRTVMSFFASGNRTQKAHFTILDHKPVVMARILVFFALLDEAATSKSSKEESLLTVAYLFCAHIVLPFVQKKLQETINRLELHLEKNDLPFKWADLSVSQIASVLRVLRSWGQASPKSYETDRVRSFIAEHIAKAIPPGMMDDEKWPYLPECEADHRVFDDFSVILAPTATLERYEPELAALVREHQTGGKGAQLRIDEYLDKHWKLNATLIDADWEANKENTDEIPDMGFDPFHLVEALTGMSFKKPKAGAGSGSAMERVRLFFERVGDSIGKLQGRLSIEMMVGDMADVLERIRYGHLDRSTGSMHDGSTSMDPGWPSKYHGIHMSNIPRGLRRRTLTNFLYAAPILKEGAGSGLVSWVLRNPPQWKSIDQFNAEYLLMYDRNLLRKHFSVKLSNLTPEPGPSLFPMQFDLPLTSYKMWERCRDSGLALDELMPQALPPPDMVSEYSITFPPFQAPDLNYPHFMMVFWHQRKYAEAPRNLRRLLLDDENGDTTSSARMFRSDGVRVLTTFKWVRKTNTATFWLGSDVVDGMTADDWTVYIWRVDSWMRLTPDLPLRGAVVRNKSWAEWVASG
ncbi:Uu.00g063520.m01.CDS01 [Anthostomella pinea]|uniref:Uu.00g063520.m01.CDS01 n=1 Tax=Anthostomella pinea TaxID=933095 RepID=A0AAI8YKL0_9PEZI|nr:Uu.00g063520.m01.CDS01 [Anthostomella pinea]